MNIFMDLEFVAHADEAELAGFLPDVFGAVGVLEELAYKPVLGLANETSQGHVQSVVVLLHKLALKEEEIETVLVKSRCKKKNPDPLTIFKHNINNLVTLNSRSVW